ncbi:hypothetical protein CR513_61550, partial [Mucuna pruriens]
MPGRTWKIISSRSLGGLSTEKPLTNLKKFLHFANTVKINNVIMNTICLRLFPFLLANRALEWLIVLSNGVITT